MKVIGCDEVGRGPIAGPVVGCAVSLSETPKLMNFLKNLNVTDSKKLTEKKRKNILAELGVDLENLVPDKSYKNHHGFMFCLQSIDEKTIDEINILQASLLAMKNSAIKILSDEKSILIDGNKVFQIDGFKGNVEAIVKGDSKNMAIALASIIAKEYRDELMKKFDQKYPGYGLASHAGYPTKAHKEAVKKLGVLPIHRRSFKGVKEYC
jgi:ribonuclease HII